MSDNSDRLQTESWLAYFRRKARFADVMLTAWSNIEYSTDMLFANEFGWSLDDANPKVKFLFKRSNFLSRLDFLKENQVVTPEEYGAIRAFDEWRNQLFHRDGWVYVHLSSIERDDAMNTAVEVVGMLDNAVNRKRRGTSPAVIGEKP